MKKNGLFIIVVILFLAWSCTPVNDKKDAGTLPEIYTRMHLEGVVNFVEGPQATITLKIPKPDTSSLPFINRVTQQIVSKSFLLENSATRINGLPAVIQEIRGDVLRASLSQPVTLKAGDRVKIYIPKKVMAITDFEVIRGYDKSIGEVSMESLTTAIVNTGQFNVVERNKLNAVLKELEIGLTGLTDTNNAKKVGTLLQADVILTGTFADLGGYWNVNMRLINVSTGLVTAAFEEKATFADIKPEGVRDAGRLNESFETELTAGWVIGSWRRFGADRTVEIDRTTGAADSHASLKMSFRLDRRGAKAPIDNNRKRDLALYSGIEFYAKADRPLVVYFAIEDTNPDDNHKYDKWVTLFEVGNHWERKQIAFDEMSMVRKYARKNPGGDGVFSLHMVERFEFGVSALQNEVGTAGSLWIDEIKFY